MTQEEMDKDYYQKLLASYDGVFDVDATAVMSVDQKKERRKKQETQARRYEICWNIIIFLAGMSAGAVVLGLMEMFL